MYEKEQGLFFEATSSLVEQRNRADSGKLQQGERVYQRKRKRFGEDGSQVYLERWKELRRTLATAIKSAKEKCWSDLIAKVDSDPWGKPYKVVMRKLRRSRPIPGIELPGRLETIVNGLFPTAPRRGTVNPTPPPPPLQ